MKDTHMAAFKAIYPENFARIPDADAVELWGINSDGESVETDAPDVTHYCVFIHIDGEGILDLVDVEDLAEAEEWAKAIFEALPD